MKHQTTREWNWLTYGLMLQSMADIVEALAALLRDMDRQEWERCAEARG